MKHVSLFCHKSSVQVLKLSVSFPFHFSYVAKIYAYKIDIYKNDNYFTVTLHNCADEILDRKTKIFVYSYMCFDHNIQQIFNNNNLTKKKRREENVQFEIHFK